MQQILNNLRILKIFDKDDKAQKTLIVGNFSSIKGM